MQDAISLLPFLYFLGALFLGCGYLFIQWRLGTNKSSNESVTIYKEQVEALNLAIDTTRKQAHELTNHVQTLTLEVGTLKGQLLEKDKKIQEYMEILRGQNPELVTLLGEIRDFMRNLNDKMELNQKRNVRLDKLAEKGN